MALGSVRRRGNAWRLTWDIPASDGKRRQATETFHGSEKDAHELLRRRMAEVDAGDWATDPRVTLATFVAKWMPVYAAKRRASTVVMREKDLRLHILPVLGPKRLRSITTGELQLLVADLNIMYHPNTVKGVIAALKLVFGQAVRWGVIPRDPTAGLEAPAAERTVRVWTAAQAKAFLDDVQDHRFYCAFVLALFSHVRIGELVALRWDDLDPSRNILRVDRTEVRAKRVTSVGPVKTQASRRSILLPDSVMDVLANHRQDQVERSRRLGNRLWHIEGWMFDRGNGERLTAGVLRNCFRKEVKRRPWLPYMTMHGLRHTGATLMLAAGEHPKIASARLGHASVGITMDLYQHSLVEMQQQAADNLAKVIDLSEAV